MKIAAAMAIVFGLGVGLGVFIQSRSEGEPVPLPMEESVSCDGSSDATIDDVKAMTSDKDRNTEANRMLADLLKLFMVDVALRISDSNKQQIGQVVPPQNCVPEMVARPEEGRSSSSPESSDSEKVLTQQLRRVVDNERQGSDLRNSSEEKDFVDGTSVDNVFPYLKNTSALPRNLVQLMEGTFVGDVQTQDEQFPVWQIEYSMSGLKQKGDALEADTRIVMKRGGKPFSNSNSNGDIRGHHKKFNGDSRAIIVESGGGAFIFQLYMISNNQKLIGTLYKKKSVDEYVPHGVVRMTRQ